MDTIELRAFRNVPDTHHRVYYGRIRPSDLVWSWCEKRWRRADDPEWTVTVPFVDMAVCVVRERPPVIERRIPLEEERPRPESTEAPRLFDL